MDKNFQKVEEMRIERTVKALRKNYMNAFFVADKEELIEKIKEILPEGASCSVGGSMTLFETGVIDLLKSGAYDYLDRYEPGIDTHALFRRALTCDVYFTSSNAVTEDGKLFNIDGNGNRVAALIYGPRKVVVVVGANKIARDIEAARRRCKENACPGNGIRLNKNIPCALTGICADCQSPERFCCHEVVTGQQMMRERITVLILPDSYGY